MALDIKRVLASAPKKRDHGAPVPLSTVWGESIDPDRVLQEHPHPQFARARYTMLNGRWEYAIVASGFDAPAAHDEAAQRCAGASVPASFDGSIIVPFSPETSLSGVERCVLPTDLLWYRRTVSAPPMAQGERCILHFEAIDHACACWCNGTLLGTHVGGYLPFSFDITDALHTGETTDEGAKACEIIACVADPSDAGEQLRGKQRIDHGGIWYTPQSGIWQSVWLEVVPESHVVSANIDASLDGESITVTASVAGPPQRLGVRVLADGAEVACGQAQAEAPAGNAPAQEEASAGSEPAQAKTPTVGAGQGTVCAHIPLPNPHAWSPDDPFLYDVELAYGEDRIESYCAFRTATMEPDVAGVQRFCLNHEPLFLRGVLDQGYWPESLLTAPSDDALTFDIQAMRDAGFNMLRKHIKVESDRWYYHCDKLGMLVWQDMVTGGGPYSAWHTSYKPTLLRWSWGRYDDSTPAHYGNLSAGSAAYRNEWTNTCLGTIAYLKNHPCIVTWVLFNEAWGQFEAAKAAHAVREADPTRPIDAVSGWYDQRCGDFLSVHNYFRPLEVYRDDAPSPRGFVISEFGGLTYHVNGHSTFDTDYGYETFTDLPAWSRAVRSTLAAADALEAQGLAGYVYTQLSDAEEETNGLLTYDRRVNKLAAAGEVAGAGGSTEENADRGTDDGGADAERAAACAKGALS